MSSGGYEAAVAGGAAGGRIASVTPGGPAARAGIEAGDRVLAVDGEPVRDVIDWRWLTAEPSFTVELIRSDGAARRAAVERECDEEAGVEFGGLVFDGVRECDNACAFCFVSQMPEGMRTALGVRDDDYRLSFLTGTFVTLTNLTDADVERIVAQRLSPLYVSVHAVDADVRRRLICPSSEDRALERLDQLGEGGIELHAQVVVVPGMNDGPALERTLGWLARRPFVRSVGVVPVGFTRFQSMITASYQDPATACAVLAALAPWRERMLAERGARWVYAADELYLAAAAVERGGGEPGGGESAQAVPPAESYDGFPQYENGIGMVRVFADEWTATLAAAAVDPCASPVDATLVTGTLFAPVLTALVPLSRRHGVTCRVLPVPNEFFGGNVSVAGLLTARDIVAAIRADSGTGPYLVPDAVVNDDGLTLDDVPGADLGALTGKDVRVVSCDAAALARYLVAATEET